MAWIKPTEITPSLFLFQRYFLEEMMQSAFDDLAEYGWERQFVIECKDVAEFRDNIDEIMNETGQTFKWTFLIQNTTDDIDHVHVFCENQTDGTWLRLASK